jgi:hypothetical protein
LNSGGLGFIEPSISWEVAVFLALLELANGMEAQPATVDATMINNIPRIIQADFLSGDIGTPISRLGVLHDNYNHSTVCQACDAVNGASKGRIRHRNVRLWPIAAVEFTDVSNHVNCTATQLQSQRAA